MKIRVLLIVLISIMLFPSCIFAFERGAFSIYGLPILMYSPETRIAGGFLGNVLWRNEGTVSEPNMILLSGIYSQNNQSSLQLITNLNWDKEKYYTYSFTDLSRFPKSFYGIGNNTSDDDEESYTPLNFEQQLKFQRNFDKNLYASVLIEYLNMKMDKTETGGLLQTGEICGSSGGRTIGLGFSAGYDSRNNAIYTQSGILSEISILSCNKRTGSDFNYEKIILDIRHFLKISDNSVLGMQLYYAGSHGTIPFYKYPELGGMERMRGYFEGQYRDKNYLTTQAEYRIIPVFWRIGITVFAAAGQVSGKIDSMSLSETKFCGGIGIRYQLNKEENFNIRLDYGIGNNSAGLYLTASEAF